MDIKISDEAEMTASVDRLGTAWIEGSVRALKERCIARPRPDRTLRIAVFPERPFNNIYKGFPSTHR